MILKTKTFLATKFYLLYYIYKQMGNKMLAVIFINCLSVLLDGIGIAMFVPLLQLADGSSSTGGTEKLMVYLKAFFDYVHMEVNLTNVIILILVLFTAKALFFFAAQYFQNKIMMDFVHQMRRRNNDALPNLSYKSFITKSFGEFQRTLQEEPGQVQEAAISYFDTIKNVVVVLIYFSLSAFFDVKFTFMVIASALLIYAVYFKINKKIKELSKEIIAVTQKHTSLTSEKIYNFKYLKATGALNFFVTRMKNFDDVVYDVFFRMARLNIFSTVIREPLLIYLVCALILIQIRFLGEAMGSMIVVLLLFYRTMGYFMSIQGSWSNFLRKSGNVEHMLKFEKFLAENQEPSGDRLQVHDIKTLELQDAAISHHLSWMAGQAAQLR